MAQKFIYEIKYKAKEVGGPAQMEDARWELQLRHLSRTRPARLIIFPLRHTAATKSREETGLWSICSIFGPWNIHSIVSIPITTFCGRNN